MEFQFRLAGIPVQVSLLFFLIVYLLGPRGEGPALLVLWAVLAFVAVLAHEMGHALVARRFGQAPRIELYGMGGVTWWRPTREMSAGQRIAVAGAGPGIGVTLGSLAWLAGRASGAHDDAGLAAAALTMFVYVNLGWGLFNLLPMLPMDGGAIVSAALEGLLGPPGRTVARIVSITCALIAALLLALGGLYIGAVLCLFFAYTNVQGLRADRTAPPAVPPTAPADLKEP
jgi:membrane-associated protease RseP (regulator of RpoE activity)